VPGTLKVADWIDIESDERGVFFGPMEIDSRADARLMAAFAKYSGWDCFSLTLLTGAEPLSSGLVRGCKAARTTLDRPQVARMRKA
jgi:hypothetical protein